MSSLAFSSVSSIPDRLSPKTQYKYGTHPAKTIRFSSPQRKTLVSSLPQLPVNKNSNPNWFRRREFITIGVQLGILSDDLIRTRFYEAVEEACEFTVSPSGLAFCDQTVGFGAPAAKGQLIKAHYVGKLEDGKGFWQ